MSPVPRTGSLPPSPPQPASAPSNRTVDQRLALEQLPNMFIILLTGGAGRQRCTPDCTGASGLRMIRNATTSTNEYHAGTCALSSLANRAFCLPGIHGKEYEGNNRLRRVRRGPGGTGAVCPTSPPEGGLAYAVVKLPDAIQLACWRSFSGESKRVSEKLKRQGIASSGVCRCKQGRTRTSADWQ